MFGKTKGEMKMPKLEIIPTQVPAAIESARKAIATHLQSGQRIAQLQVALDRAIETESAGAVAALESGAALPDATVAASVSAQLEVLKRASEKTRAKALEAIAGIYRAAAEQERALAEHARARREDILTKLRKPLSEIALLIGVPEVPLYTLRNIPRGVWTARFGTEVNFQTMGPGDCSPTVPAANPTPYAIPSFDRLVREIEAHEKRAAELELRQIDGSADLDATLASIIAEVMPAPAAAASEAA